MREMIERWPDDSDAGALSAIFAAFACTIAGSVACLSGGLYFIDTMAALVLMSLGIAVTAAVVLGRTVSGRWMGRSRSRSLLNCKSQPVLTAQLALGLVLSGPFIIASLYAAHLAAGPLSQQANGETVLAWSFYGCFGLFIYYAGCSVRGRKALAAGWGFLGLLLGVTALAAVYGLFPYPAAIFRTEQAELSAYGARLGGLLQYPNTFGAVMGVFFLERLMSLARMSAADFTRQRGWRGYTAACCAFIYVLCLLLTESRGACIAVAAAGLAGLCQLQGADRSRYVGQSGALLLCGSVAAWQLSSASLAPSLLPGLFLLAATGGTAMITARHIAGRGTRWLAAVSILLAAGHFWLWLGHGLPERAGSLATASARILMYRDAWSLFISSPWLGQGGRTWEIMFRAVQSSAYVGGEIHSGYMNIVLDIGLAGLAAVLLWLTAAGVTLVRMRSIMWPSYLVILLHSAVDFSLSYGLTWLLLIWMACSGISRLSAVSVHSTQSDPIQTMPMARLTRIQFVHSAQLDRPPHSTQPQITELAWPMARHLRHSGTLIVMTLLLLVSLSGVRQAVSLARERQALTAAALGRAEQAVELLEQSLAIYPARSSARLHLAGLSNPDGRAKVLRQGLAYDRADPELWSALGRALSGSRPMEAVSAWEHAVKLDPYSRKRQTEVLSHLASLARQLKRDQRPKEAMAAALSGYKLYIRYEELAKRLANATTLRNDRRFIVTEEAKDRGRELGEYVFRYSPDTR